MNNLKIESVEKLTRERLKGQRLEAHRDFIEDNFSDLQQRYLAELLNNTRHQVGNICPTCRIDAASVHKLVANDDARKLHQKAIRNGRTAARKLDEMHEQAKQRDAGGGN